MAVSCQIEGPLQDENKGTITVTPAEVTFGMDGGEQLLTLTLVSDSKQWTLSQPEGMEWCKVDRSSGRTSTTLKLTVTKNTSSVRTAVLQFASPGCESAIVTVTQEGVNKEAMPEGLMAGINYNQDNSVTFVFMDKDNQGKCYDYAYLIGEFNNWEPSAEYVMNRDDQSGCWWVVRL